MNGRAVAVVGAGISGLAAARELTKAGVAVTVLEKSRNLGGRMATRRSERFAFDHGAQYFTARDPGFAAQLATWTSSGDAAPWFENAIIGVPGMTAPARALAEGTAIELSRTVTGLRRTGTGWQLDCVEGPIVQPPSGFDAVLLAIPAPQAMSILAKSSVPLPGVEAAIYSPCWALMVAFDEPIAGIPERLRPNDGTLSWVALNSTKSGRPHLPACYVTHARPDWSMTHLELAPQAACEQLLAAFRRLADRPPAPPVHAVAHRWRYALVEQAINQHCLWDAEARIGACGDWCLGSRVEAAFMSGVHLGQAATAALEPQAFLARQ